MCVASRFSKWNKCELKSNLSFDEITKNMFLISFIDICCCYSTHLDITYYNVQLLLGIFLRAANRQYYPYVLKYTTRVLPVFLSFLLLLFSHWLKLWVLYVFCAVVKHIADTLRVSIPKRNRHCTQKKNEFYCDFFFGRTA